MIATVVLWVPRLRGPLDLRYDAGAYYVLGTSLGEGNGYRLLNEPGRIEAIQYPPLLPMIVAAHQRLVGSRAPAVTGHALRLTWAVLFLVYALAVYALARRWLRAGWALVASLLVVLHLELLWLSDALFAELPFACATVLFLLVAERDERRGLAALLGGAAYLLRASGLALLVAWVVDALLARRVLEAALRAALAALPVLVWQAYVTEVQTRPEFVKPAYAYQRAPYNFYNVGYAANMAYRDAFEPERGIADGRDLVRRVVDNALALPERLGESIGVRAEGPLRPVFHLRDDPPPPSRSLALNRFGCTLIGLVAAAGLGMLVLDGIRLAPLVWLASLALATLTPWPSQFGRYLMPLAPLTAIGLALVLENASRVASLALQTAAGAAIGVLLAAEVVVLGTVFSARHTPVAAVPGATPQRLFFYSHRWQLHDEALAWLARQAAPGAIAATATPHRLYLMSGLRAVFPPFDPDANRAERQLREVPIDWVVIDDLEFLDVSRRYAEPAVLSHPEHWRLAYGASTGGPRIYRRIRP
ncbi:MAG: hypothetical protein IT293_10605 [Deltaproteobacteria bacterium]|nr:hypothetical protein [Deltaproteobacteria bacterium]